MTAVENVPGFAVKTAWLGPRRLAGCCWLWCRREWSCTSTGVCWSCSTALGTCCRRKISLFWATTYADADSVALPAFARRTSLLQQSRYLPPAGPTAANMQLLWAELEYVTSVTIFINSKSTTFCQITLLIKLSIHKRKVFRFFCLMV